MLTRAERISGGLWGLLIGDALGVPYEFHAASDLPPRERLDFMPPPGFSRSHPRVPPGTWSDDGAQALCLLASLLDRGALDLDDLGQRLVAWYTSGYLTADGIVFDVGIQTSTALRALRSGVPARNAGPAGEKANGNGSLMRVLPLALWHRGSDDQLVADAHEQSRVTHAHLRSMVCCAAYCLWARQTLAGSTDAWAGALRTLREIYRRSDDRALNELDAYVLPDAPPDGRGTGYVVDCLLSARLVMGAGSYEHVVRAAVALGNDTDTTAAVAGGIAGVRDGERAIPAHWRAALCGQAIVEPLLTQLVAR